MVYRNIFVKLDIHNVNRTEYNIKTLLEIIVCSISKFFTQIYCRRILISNREFKQMTTAIPKTTPCKK